MTDLAPPVWSFVPAELDAGDLAQLEPLFAELEERHLRDVGDLERWLRDESELQAKVAAKVARRYIRMTCHTEDEAAKRAYLEMEQDVLPRAKVLSDRLDKKLLGSAALAGLDQDRYGVLIKQRRTASEIFREENTELQKEDAELQTRQQTLMGSMTVEFEGVQHTMQQMSPYYESQDRTLRERAFRASLEVRRQHWEELEQIFEKLVALRTRMGLNAGFETYTPYRFLDLCRFDYTPETCLEFHRAIEETVVPLVEELNQQRQSKLGVASLRPWDLEVDLDGNPPFVPFSSEEELIELARKVFHTVDTRFREEFDVLQREQLLDLMSRKGKAPGGYQYTLEDVRLPFIFANSVGMHHDVQTLLHEGGHAFHAILSRGHELLSYRDSPIEFAETASMSMELMGLENIKAVYSQEDAARVRHKHLEGILRLFPWIASIDAFQHEIYGNPGWGQKERQEAWLKIRDRFSRGLDYSGLEDALAWQWTGQGHLYHHAFYYIEYGIAQVAALQVWQRYRRDASAAVEAYRQGLALGGCRPLPELFHTAGVKFDLSTKMLGALVDEIREQLRMNG